EFVLHHFDDHALHLDLGQSTFPSWARLSSAPSSTYRCSSPAENGLPSCLRENQSRMSCASCGFFAPRSAVIFSMKSTTQTDWSCVGLVLKSFRLIACAVIRTKKARKSFIIEDNQNRMNRLQRSSKFPS